MPELRWSPSFRALSCTNWIWKNWPSSRDVTGGVLQIFRVQARMLGNFSKDDRPQFFFVVIGETILGPTLTP